MIVHKTFFHSIDICELVQHVVVFTAQVLRNEKLFVASEKQLLMAMYGTLNETIQDFMKASWVWRKRWRDLRQHMVSGSPHLAPWQDKFFEQRLVLHADIYDEISEILCYFATHLCS